jgi:hypothetical protein
MGQTMTSGKPVMERKKARFPAIKKLRETPLDASAMT